MNLTKLIVVFFSCQWTRETKFPHAVWAAGRGLIALLLPNFDVVDNLWLEPCSWEVSHCHILRFYTSTGYLVYIALSSDSSRDTFETTLADSGDIVQGY